jgi:dTDP-4-amino-4,6-dideoxygalactose transaminase
MHQYYLQMFGPTDDLPRATARFSGTLSLPLFPTMTADEVTYVVDRLRDAIDAADAAL